MLTRRILMLAPLFLLTADHGGGNGGSSNASDDTSAVNTLPQARKRISDLEASATTTATAHGTEVVNLTKERNDAKTAQSQAEQVAATNATERDAARTELATANTVITTLTGERDIARTNLGKANTNVARLEGLCRLRGLSTDEVPDAANDEDANSGATLYEQWKSLTGAAKTAFRRKHEAALNAYADSLNRRQQ